MPFLAQLLVGVGLQILGYMLTPRPRGPKDPELTDIEDPTAEAGRPMQKVFGTKTVKSPNILYFGDKAIRVRKVKA